MGIYILRSKGSSSSSVCYSSSNELSGIKWAGIKELRWLSTIDYLWLVSISISLDQDSEATVTPSINVIDLEEDRRTDSPIAIQTMNNLVVATNRLSLLLPSNITVPIPISSSRQWTGNCWIGPVINWNNVNQTNQWGDTLTSKSINRQTTDSDTHLVAISPAAIIKCLTIVKTEVASLRRDEMRRDDGLVGNCRPGIGLIKGMTVVRLHAQSVDGWAIVIPRCTRITSHYRCASKSLEIPLSDSSSAVKVSESSRPPNSDWLVEHLRPSLPIRLILLMLLLFLLLYWPTFSIRFGINGIKQFFSPGFRMKETVPTRTVRLGVSNNKVTTYD